MAIKEIAELIKTLAAEKGVSVEAVIMELQTSVVTFDSLEFTVRTQNVLAMNEIDSIDKLCSVLIPYQQGSLFRLKSLRVWKI